MTEQKTPTNWPSKASRKKSKYRQPFRAVKRRRKPLRQESNGMPKPWHEFKHLARYKILRPFYFIEWCFEHLVYRLRRWALLDFLDQVSQFTVLVAVIIYLLGAQQRKEDRITQNLILLSSSAQVQGGDMAIKALENLNKEGYSLDNSQLDNFHLSGVNLSGAILFEANLSGANLFVANLSKATLHKANLSGANLFAANLSKAYLREAKFSGADLYGVLLNEADLSGADLGEADLGEVDFRKVFGLTFDQLKEVKSLYKCENLDPELEAQLRKEKPCLFIKEGCE